MAYPFGQSLPGALRSKTENRIDWDHRTPRWKRHSRGGGQRPGAAVRAAAPESRPLLFEPLEPRLLLSADLVPIAGQLADGLNALDDTITSFLDEDLFDSPLPLVVRAEDLGDGVKSVAPTIRDLFSFSVDLDGDGQVGTSGSQALQDLESKLQSFDKFDSTGQAGGDGRVDFGELFRGLFIDPLTNGTDGFLDQVTAGQTTTDLVAKLNTLDDDFPLDAATFDVNDVSTTVGPFLFGLTAQDTSTDNQASVSLRFDLEVKQDLPVDLGLDAEALGLSVPSSDVTVTADLGFNLEFGALTSGGAEETPEFFLALDDVGAGASAQLTPTGEIVNLGFLSLEIGDGASISLNAAVDGGVEDPTSPAPLGFLESQFDADNPASTAADGILTALGSGLTDFNLPDVSFFLRIGDSDAREVVLAAQDHGDLDGLLSNLQSALDAAGFLVGVESLITAENVGGAVSLQLVDTNGGSLGLAVDGPVTGASPVFDSDPLAAAFELAVDATFLLSLAGAVPRLVKVTKASTEDNTTSFDQLLQDVNDALVAAGFVDGTNAPTVQAVKGAPDSNGDDTIDLVAVGGGSLEVVGGLSLDSRITLSDLQSGQTLTAFADADSSYDVNLPLKVVGGADIGFDPTGLALEVSVADVFGFERTADSDGSQRIELGKDPDGLDILQQIGDFDQFANFNKISASDVVGLLRQLESFLDGLDDSAVLANFTIPFVEDAFAAAVDFADLLSDSLLFDDGDDGQDGVDNDNPVGTNDIGKLLIADPDSPDPANAALIPDFATLQDLADTLFTLFGDSIDPLRDQLSDFIAYNATTGVLTFSFDLSSTFLSVDQEIDFSAGLGSDADGFQFAGISTDSLVRLSASGSGTFTVGIDLSDDAGFVDPNGDLTPTLAASDLLADLGITLKDELAITGEPLDLDVGRLSADAVFEVSFDGKPAIEVTVTREATKASTGFDFLLAAVNGALTSALDGTEFAGDLVAIESDGKIALQEVGASFDTLTISADAGNTAVTELGFAPSQEVEDDPDDSSDDETLTLVAEDKPLVTVGRFAGDVTLTLDVGGVDKTITLTEEDTQANRSVLDLVNDINAALDEVFQQSGERSRLATADGGPLVFSLFLNPDQDDPATQENESEVEVTIDPDVAAANRTVAELVVQLQAAVDAAVGTPGEILVQVDSDNAIGFVAGGANTLGDPAAAEIIVNDARVAEVVASAQGARIVLTGPDGTTPFSVDSVTPAAGNELGFAGGETANKDDLRIVTSDGAEHFVDLRDRDGDGILTLQDIFDSISADTGGSVVAGLFEALKAANELEGKDVRSAPDTAILLVDKTSVPGGTPADEVAVFRVEGVNGSSAAQDFGIQQIDVATDENDDGRINALDGDNLIEGSSLAGIALTDRFFIEEASLEATAGLSTPAKNFTGLTFVGDDKDKLFGSGFTTDDIGKVLKITGGTNFEAGIFTIIAVDEAEGSVTLDAEVNTDPGTADGSGGVGQIAGLQAAAQLGFVGVTLLGDGNLSGTISGIGLDTSGGPITLGELVDSLLAGQVASLFDTPTLTGSGSLDFEVFVTPSFGPLDLGGDIPRFLLAVDSFGLDGSAPVFDPTIENFGNLLDFKDLSLSDVIALLQNVSDLLGQFESFGFLDDPIPLIDLSVNDLLDFTSRFAMAVKDFQSNPAGSIQALDGKLKDVLGLAPDSELIELSLETVGPAGSEENFLRLDLNLGAAFNDTLGVSFDLGDAGILTGAADLSAQAEIAFSLALGISLATPSKVVLFTDNTRLSGNLRAAADNLNFRAALGPLGVFVKGGNVEIGGTAQQEGAPPDSETYLFDIELNDSDGGGDGVVTLSAVLGDLGAAFAPDADDFGAAFEVTLPVFFPVDSIAAGSITFNPTLSFDPTTFDLKLEGQLTPSAVDKDGEAFRDGQGNVLEGAEALAALFDISDIELGIFDSLLLGVDGIDLFLEGLQDVLDGEVFGVQLPFVGDSLSDGARFIEDFRESFVDPFQQELERRIDEFRDPATNPMSEILNDLLGDLLLEPVAFDFEEFDDSGTAEDDRFVQWNLKIGELPKQIVGADIDFDLGIPGLGLETEGSVGINLGWSLSFGFGLSFEDGFYLDIQNDPDPDNGVEEFAPELMVNLEVTLPERIAGQLAILQLQAIDTDNDKLTVDFAVDIQNRSDATDTRLAFSELGKLGLAPGIKASANVDLDLVLGLNPDLFGAAAVLPEITSGFVFNWSIQDDQNPGGFVSFSDLSGDLVRDGLERVSFDAVSLDLGTYISQFISPILGEIQKFTQPLQPIIDIITDPLPVISDLGPDVTLLDLARIFAPNINVGFIESVAELVSLINSIPTDTGDVVIKFGDFVIFNHADPEMMPDITNPNFDRGSLSMPVLTNDPFEAELAKPDQSPGDRNTKDFAKRLKDSGSFSLPILTDPSQIFGLLLGNDATLVEYNLKPLDFDFSYSQFFPIFGPLGASITAQFGINIGGDEGIGFGFDTFGLKQFSDSGFRDPGLIFNGFFIQDNPGPELSFDGGISAAAELNLGVARGGVGGGLFAEVNFDLFDPNDDEKVRVDELIGNVLNEIKFGNPALAPIAIFDVTGEITAKLFAFLKINLLFLKINKTFDITPEIVLFSFETDFFRPPKLATELAGGDLQLNMGEFADQRLNGSLIDGDEQFFAEQVDSNTVRVWAPNLGISKQNAQEYDVTGKIIALGGEGNDVIDLSGVTANLDFELEGGAGSDEIRAGTGVGVATIRGGVGDDELHGGGGADRIFGEAGNDKIYGNGGKDLIFGDDGRIRESRDASNNPIETWRARAAATDGDDEIWGGAGGDIIFGGGGVDDIDGEAGEDLIFGDSALLTADATDEDNPVVLTIEDTASGLFSGSDLLKGGEDADTIFGGKGDDQIRGGAGADQLFGEAGNDLIGGEAGSDTILGGEGDDLLIGGSGGDVIGATEADRVGDPNASSEDIEPEAGNDVIFGDFALQLDHTDFEFPSSFFAFRDTLVEAADAQAGADFLAGGRGDNLIFGGAGNDVIESRFGDDFLDGGANDDTYLVLYEGGRPNKRVTVADSGETISDQLTLYATEQDDELLARAGVADDADGFVALLQGENRADIKRVDYSSTLDVLILNLLGGDDFVAFDDNRVNTTVFAGEGNDTFQFGQLFKSERTVEAANIADPADEFSTVETTRGFLSPGVSAPTTVFGDAGEDTFIVFRNEAVLQLNGGDDNDTFIVRAFALVGSEEDKARERTDISGAGGADFIQYVINAPVSIDGGDGLDTIRVIGTEFSDDFVITKDGVFGAGLNVKFVGVEVLTIDGAEGDDRFFVQSTDPGVKTVVFGGLGSDSFNIAGDAPPVVSNDLLGHSGIITHGVESADPRYAAAEVEGISANVADNDEPAIIVTRSTETLRLVEQDAIGLDGLKLATYAVVLSRPPIAGVVKVTANKPPVGPDAPDGTETLRFVASAGQELGPDGRSVTLNFDANNWFIPQLVTIEAPADDTVEGPTFGVIQHQVTAEDKVVGAVDSVLEEDRDGDGELDSILVDNDAAFATDGEGLKGATIRITEGPGKGQERLIKSNSATEIVLNKAFNGDLTGETKFEITRFGGIQLPNIAVKIEDPDAAGVIITQSEDSTKVFEEGNPGSFDSDTYEIVLTKRPDFPDGTAPEDQVVTISLSNADGNLEGFPATVTFDATNWFIPQQITVSAVDDAVKEGFHFGYITHSIASADPEYAALFVEQLQVEIGDNEVPGVLVLQSGGSTDVIEFDPATVAFQGQSQTERNNVFGPNVLTFDFDLGGVPIIGDAVLTVSAVADLDLPTEFLTLSAEGQFATDLFVNDGAQQSLVSRSITIDQALLQSLVSGDNTASFTVTPNFLGNALGVNNLGANELTLSLTLPAAIADPTGLVEAAGFPKDDTYQIVLTAPPVFPEGTPIDEQVVTVTIDPAETRTTRGDVIALFQDQVTTDPITLTFTADNWYIPQEVKVSAIDDPVVDGGDTKQFAPVPNIINQIQGPLFIEGAGGEGSLEGLDADPLLLTGETNIRPSTGEVEGIAAGTTDTIVVATADLEPFRDESGALDLVNFTLEITEGPGKDQTRLVRSFVVDGAFTTLVTDEAWDDTDLPDGESKYALSETNPNLLVDESEQVDLLTVFNNDSVADLEGELFNLDPFVDGEGRTIERSRIVGLGMGPDVVIDGAVVSGGITYQQLENVTLLLGSGDDTLTVNGTHTRDGFQTVTLVNTGGGNDTVTVNLEDGTDGFFALDTQEGDDTIDASASSLPLLLIGGDGEDDITGGSGDDIIFGDKGLADYIDDNGKIVTRFGIAAERFAGEATLPATGTLDLLTDSSAAFPTEGRKLVGLEVTIITDDGEVFRRVVTDNTATTLTLDAALDLDPGSSVEYRLLTVPSDQTDGVFRQVTVAQTRDSELGADDVITGGDGRDIVFGGNGADIIDALGSDQAGDIILGDHGQATFDAEGNLAEVRSIDPARGGDDQITGGVGPNIVLGGAGSDRILAGGDLSPDVILGDNGIIRLVDGLPREVSTFSPESGGDDIIVAGDGPNILVGGSGSDEITGGAEAGNIILGDNGTALFSAAGDLTEIFSSVTLDSEGRSFGGDDRITAGNGADVIIGGSGADTILAGGDDDAEDIVLGDNGRATFGGNEPFAPGEETAILSFNFNASLSNQTVTGEAGAEGARAGNWINLTGDGPTVYGNEEDEPVTFDDGSAAPGITIEWGADLDVDPDNLDGDRHSQISPGDDQDKRLFEGYLSSRTSETLGVDISGLGNHFQSYDVYVYLDADNGRSRSGDSVRAISDGSTTYYLNDARGNTFTGEYILVEATDPNLPQTGNYVVFRGLTADVTSIRIDDDGTLGSSSSNRPSISALQIVGQRLPIDRIESTLAEDGGDDIIVTGGGADIVIGGSGNDRIDTFGSAVRGATDADVVMGDSARATFAGGELRTIESTFGEIGGGDEIRTGNGEDLVFGGLGNDSIDTASEGGFDNGDVRVLSFNFNSGVDKGLVTGVAGAVQAENWNNLVSDGQADEDNDNDPFTRAEFSDSVVFDDGSNAQDVKIVWGEELDTSSPRAAGRDSHDEIGNPDTENERLFEGYLQSDNDRTLGAEITGLNTHFTSYDVYVYLDADNGKSAPDNSVRSITDGTTTYYLDDADGNTFAGEYVLVEATDPNLPGVGNYVVFRGLTSDTVSIRIDSDPTLGGGGANRPSIAAIQVVGGADKDAVVIGSDSDRDIAVGDNGLARLLGGTVYEVTTGESLNGDDDIVTGEGADLVLGGSGGDSVDAGAGHDVVFGDNARVTQFEGEIIDLDRDDLAGNFDPFQVEGIELLGGNEGGDSLTGGTDDDLVYGQGGDDVYVFAGAGLGNDHLVDNGDNGQSPNDAHDRLDFSGFDAPVRVDLGPFSLFTVNGDRFNGDINLKLKLSSTTAFEDVTGTAFDDQLFGNTRNNTILGGDGVDSIFGRDGDDLLLGGAGGDFIYGNAGSDLIDGGAGDDLIFGDSSDSSSGSRDFILGGEGDDTVRGGLGDDLIDGEAGNDDLRGDGGADTILGGAGADFIRGDGGVDVIEGGDGVDDVQSGGADQVEQDTGAGLLGLAPSVAAFDAAFGLEGFFFVDPTVANPGQDRPLRAWVGDFLETVPGNAPSLPFAAASLQPAEVAPDQPEAPLPVPVAASPAPERTTQVFDESLDNLINYDELKLLKRFEGGISRETGFGAAEGDDWLFLRGDDDRRPPVAEAALEASDDEPEASDGDRAEAPPALAGSLGKGLAPQLVDWNSSFAGFGGGDD